MAIAHRKIAIEAKLNRNAAVVNTPNPKRLILIATALAPKRVHKNSVKAPAVIGSSRLLGTSWIIALSKKVFLFKMVNPPKLCGLSNPIPPCGIKTVPEPRQGVIFVQVLNTPLHGSFQDLNDPF